jgi:outer membrane protein assembly factor BamB
LAAVGGVVFVADDLGTECSSGSVVEVSATSGHVLRVISGRRFHLDCPSAIAIAGNDLFVGSYQYVTEIDARSGALVRVIASRGHGFNSVDAMSVAGQTLFVASEFATSADQRSATTIAEINTRTGNLIKLLGGPRYRFESPSAMAVSGPDLFVTNGGTGNAGTAGASVTEINAATGAVVRVIVGRQYRFDYPDVIAVAGNHLLVTSGNGGPVTEIDASTGALVRVISLSPSRALLFFAAGAIAVWHDRVYVSDVGANTVVEFAA